ncbi:paraquat-inducible protein A [Aliikangiella sp. IMCC44653]
MNGGEAISRYNDLRNQVLNKPELFTACHECDLLLRLPEPESYSKLQCPRCAHVISRFFKHGQDKLLSMSIAALVALFLSFCFPFLTFISRGSERTVSLLDSLKSIGEFQFESVSLLMFATITVIPCIFLMLIVGVIAALKMGKAHWPLASMSKIIFLLSPWNMAEIFLVGILVSLVKITSMAQIKIGLSFYAFSCFILCLTFVIYFLDKHQFWRWLKDSIDLKENQCSE